MLLTYLMVILFFVKIGTKCKKKSGGIIIIYKTSLSRYINFFENDSARVQWVELDVISPESILFLGCVYISPANTRYASESCITEI
jgi:hypothetical protein